MGKAIKDKKSSSKNEFDEAQNINSASEPESESEKDLPGLNENANQGNGEQVDQPISATRPPGMDA